METMRVLQQPERIVVQILGQPNDIGRIGVCIPRGFLNAGPK